MSESADYIFHNGPVITVNHSDDINEVVAVKDNRIVFVGKEEDGSKYVGHETKVIDLEGRCILPGFIDSHLHYNVYGMKQNSIIDIDYGKAGSIEEIISLIRSAADKKKQGEWISLWGYDQNKLKENRHPTIADLDKAAPNNPVRCTRCCGHMGVYNSLALKKGGVKDGSNFASGEVVIEDGKLTGLLKENAHMYMGQSVVFSEEEIMEGLLKADQIMARYGVTTVHDAGSDGSEAIRLMEYGTRKRELKTRISIMIFDLAGVEPGKILIDKFISTGLTSGFGNEHFKIGPAKIMLDGSSSGPSSATRKPYSHDPNLKGILVWTQDEVDQQVKKIHEAGYQVTAHAVGDLAVEIMVNAIEKAMTQYPRENPRHRIEHCGITNPEQINRIQRLGIIPISNPGFIELNGSDYNRYYGDRVNYMFPLKSYLEAGIITAIGSDAPVIHPNPMLGIYGALTRKDGKSGEVVGGEQKISIIDAIRMYTYNGAYVSFEEEKKGSIEVGKLADMVVLSENILETSTDRIKEVLVDYTMIDGEIVYQR